MPYEEEQTLEPFLGEEDTDEEGEETEGEWGKGMGDDDETDEGLTDI
jgi:hypothetical protein